MTAQPEEVDEVVVIGPIAPCASGLIYHVTLESGMIVTSPDAFGTSDASPAMLPVVVTADGRFLVPPVHLDDSTESRPMEPA